MSQLDSVYIVLSYLFMHILIIFFPVDYFLQVAQKFLGFLMSVRPSYSPPRRIFKVFNIGDLTQNCRVSPDVVIIGQKYRVLYIKT
jgi:hypothetical protein